MREGILLDALIGFERRYALHTPKSVSHEGTKAWALSVVLHSSLCPQCLDFVAWRDFHTHSHFAHSTIPGGKRGTTRSLRKQQHTYVPQAKC